MEETAPTESRSLSGACKKYCPNLVVYLPKDVTVQNPKLGLLNLFNMFLVLLFTMYYFYTNDNYIVTKVPEITLAICGERCLNSRETQDDITSAALNQGFCRNPMSLDIEHEGTRYFNAECVGRCGSNLGSTSSCMTALDFVETGSNEVFMPTFYTEDYYLSPTASGRCARGTRPVYSGVGANRTLDKCTKGGAYWVAGAEHSRLVFNHEFLVKPYETLYNLFSPAVDQKSHSGSFASVGWDKSLVTILFDREGNEQAIFNQSRAADLTLGDLLRAAAYEPLEEEGPNLNLDMLYSNGITGIERRMPLRLTGGDLMVDLFSTDTGECPVYDNFREIVKKLSVPKGRPVTCMTVFVERRWVAKEVGLPVGDTGGLRIRRMNGFQVRFRKMGAFKFLDDQAMFNNTTVFFVWIKLPLQMTTFFCLCFLGKLSGIYGRVMNEELNLTQACKGLMARLMHHSAAFMDLQDHELGISKQRIHDRFKDFLLDNEDIDEDELNRFVEFVFDGLKGTGNHPNSDKDYVSLQEFCEVCASNEPLNFQALVQLFDNDRQQGVLESFFMDQELQSSQGSSARETLKIEPVDYTKVSEEDRRISHSRVETAAMDVEDMLKNLKVMESKAFRTADTLEIGDEALGLSTGDTESTAAEPKLDQRESFCSVADEEDECGGGEEPQGK
mmetsp:Transcript_116935/g.342435  ORF Transcript_116935/g.342435 Transcript_116935/m.342435 type:complete len:672 (-) Transcript_116935:96-2111(-)